MGLWDFLSPLTSLFSEAIPTYDFGLQDFGITDPFPVIDYGLEDFGATIPMDTGDAADIQTILPPFDFPDEPDSPWMDGDTGAGDFGREAARTASMAARGLLAADGRGGDTSLTLGSFPQFSVPKAAAPGIQAVGTGGTYTGSPPQAGEPVAFRPMAVDMPAPKEPSGLERLAALIAKNAQPDPFAETKARLAPRGLERVVMG